ncbi:MAG TPA: NADH-quinone oxidoreductase subunit C, partial [Puia sp.]|nr:NADH-quinone oxidoreductase subunit C [Puia sp.]
MDKAELKTKIAELLPAATFEDGAEWTTAGIDAADWAEAAPKLRSSEGLDFDYMFCMTAVDWKTHLTMVYHLTSTVHRQVLVVKVKLDRQHPVLATASHIWRTAEFHER